MRAFSKDSQNACFILESIRQAAQAVRQRSEALESKSNIFGDSAGMYFLLDSEVISHINSNSPRVIESGLNGGYVASTG